MNCFIFLHRVCLLRPELQEIMVIQWLEMVIQVKYLELLSGGNTVFVFSTCFQTETIVLLIFSLQFMMCISLECINDVLLSM